MIPSKYDTYQRSQKTRINLLGGILATVVIILITFSFVYLDIPIGAQLDFSQFHADLYGLIAGDKFYDEKLHAIHYAERFQLVNVPLLNPPAYPPWYYLTFAPLGFLSLEPAARLWALLNFIILFVSILILSNGQSTKFRFLALVLGFCFAPVVGHLIVGQQTLIILLGCAVIAVGFQNLQTTLVIIGSLLLTYKPHLGIPIIFFTFIWAILLNTRFVLALIPKLFITSIILFFICYIFDTNWLIEYVRSLSRLSELSLNRVCDSCASITLVIESSLPHLIEAFWLQRVLGFILIYLCLCVPLLIIRNRMNSYYAVSLAVLLVLLSAPYVRNYDYVLMLFPLIIGLRTLSANSGLSSKLYFTCSYLLVGIAPMFSERSLHGILLILGAFILYLMFLLFLAKKQKTLV